MTASVPLRGETDILAHGKSVCCAPAVNSTPLALSLRAAAMCAAWLIVGCAPQTPPVDRIKAHGELRVVTLNSPTAFYQEAQGPEGFEFQLASRFARELGVKLFMYPANDVRAMQAELATGRADIAAAQLTADAGWTRVGEVSASYEQIEQFVVYRQGKTRPRSTLQIEASRLAVRAGSPQERILERMKKTVAPTLRWVVTAPDAADPLEDVTTGQADYAVVDARELSFARHIYPDVDVGFSLPQSRPTQWIVRRGAHDLLQRINQFFAAQIKSGALAALERQASGDVRPFEYEESHVFREHVMERLPRYQPLFTEAATQTGLDWRLLAAIGYQESKWNASAESEDGARGLMMLTPSTAEAMGITDRADPRQNILAGARYFADVRIKVPERIREPDRTWLALAAYNVGFGHLEDARIIAQTRGLNPDSWADVRKELPLLAQERWYAQAKHGYARGWEPVQFVDRVQRYLTLLEWQPEETAAGAPNVIAASPQSLTPP
jgi:membrane-bound lytic murein transglycosylase F